jgi:hypothetical protein
VKTGGLRSRSASDQHRYDRFSIPTTFAAMRARVTRRRSLAAETESGSRLVIKLRLARPLPPEWRARAFSTFCSNSRRHHAMIDSRAATSPLLYRSPGLPCANGFDERRPQRDALPDTRNIWPRSANQRVDRGPSEALRRADTSFPEVSYAAGGQRGRALNGSCRHEASRI